MTGRAVRFVAPGRVELAEVSVPEPADGELLVRAEYSGISGGTEMLAYRGELDPELPRDETLEALSGTFVYPFTYGYSAVGRVERSRGSIPERARVFAFHCHQDLFVVGEQDVIRLDGEDPRRATLLPLVETALQVCLDAGPRLGEVVAVLGLGCVGALTSALLIRAGARVVASEPREERRRAAARLGVEAVAPERLGARLDEITGGGGVPLVIEASGSPDALAAGLPLLAHEGTALVCSWYGTKPVPLPLGADFHRRRLVIRSTQVSTIPSEMAARWDRRRRRDAARALLSELELDPLATHEFPFERAPDAYAAVAGDVPDLIHAALRYGP
ncbi:MAG TPA: zinc-binding dehydrogenase [Thermoleophilaceae bacterium]|jgi:2-desacetyl-2-hydroxyethyl bacteriochlorophyllide A dehydrogenase|nr:zinc-binding dehydrogenase [Thermoleophilaceae bacterium]